MNQDIQALMAESDKAYWHRYVDFYNEGFRDFECQSILEFGIWRGASIRWLMNAFPNAKIHGADIIDQHESWPTSDRVSYFQVDQGEVEQIDAVLNAIGAPLDLIVEDGSHHPVHQRNCLVRSIGRLRAGGIYILEDIHTSHPSHPMFKQCRPLLGKLIGPLHLLLAIDHLKSVKPEDAEHAAALLSRRSLFNESDVSLLMKRIDSIRIFKRSHLPLKCFACSGVTFDYAALRCECGTNLYAEADSMSAMIRVK